MNPSPKAINLYKNEGYLQIEWQDGRICKYPLSHLREACPCVECRGGHQFMGMKYAPENILSLKPARSYTMTQIDAIGNYAIQPTWDDGHSTGLYTWEYLHHLCPPEPSEDTEA
jgi:DUF971 family protein